MASGASPIHLVRSNTALDPVGVCLALEGRLNSAEGREALTGALRSASQGEGRCLSSSSSSSKAGGTEGGAAGHVWPSAAAAGPKCLSAQVHQLSGDCLSAFCTAGSEQQPADNGEAACRCNCSSENCRCLDAAGSAPLSKQDTLLHPIDGADHGMVQQGCSSSGGGADRAGADRAGATSPPQRPAGMVVNAAIERTSTATLDANGGVDHGVGAHDPTCTCPPYAVKSTCGKRANMEDTYALCPNICELPMSPMSHEYADKLPHRIAVQFETHCQEFPREQPAATAAAAASDAATPTQQPAQQRQQQGSTEQLQLQQPQQQHGAASKQSTPSAATFAGAAQLPGQLVGAAETENSVSSMSSSSDGGVSVEKLHFFGVYDGHGGIEASQHCAQRLHYHLSKAVADMASNWLISNAGDEVASPWNPEVRYSPLDTARVDESSPGECFLAATSSTDESAAGEVLAASSSSTASSGLVCSTSSGSSSSTAGTAPPGAAGASGPAANSRDFGRSISAGSGGSGSSGSPGNDSELDSNEGSSGDSSDSSAASFTGMMEDVLRDAFIKTDEEFKDSGLQAGLVGSTAVVALVGTHRVWIANCGDSRAVLSRGGKAIQVTDDHKPEREDEAERVEKAGGQVLYWNGHRVMGVLAMSRAIGDHCLRPYVIPEPEISVFARHTRDELLLLASDGLWDVLGNQEATDLALRSIKRAREKGASRKAAARVAATVLTKAAVDRGSRDNITVVIIDLSPPPAAGQRPCAADKANLSGQRDTSSAAGVSQPRQQSLLLQQVQQQQVSETSQHAASAGCRSGSTSHSGSRQGSMKPAVTRSGSGSMSNPFAAAAASPFSTAATGSSEMPLPTGATASAATADAAVPAAAMADRSVRSSGGGSSSKLRSAGVSAGAGSSAFATASLPAAVSSEFLSCCSDVSGVGALASELDSIDLSGAQAVRGVGRKDGLPSVHSMADASSAADGSTTSSQLEEQPTIVEPPPALSTLGRQASSSPFSAFQSVGFGENVGFGDS